MNQKMNLQQHIFSSKRTKKLLISQQERYQTLIERPIIKVLMYLITIIIIYIFFSYIRPQKRKARTSI